MVKTAGPRSAPRPRHVGDVPPRRLPTATRSRSMKRLALALSLLFSLAAGSAWAQDPFEPAELSPPAKAEPRPQGHQLTPEMYRYIVDLQRYGGPTDLTRLRAQAKAQQRMERIASMKWYGMSNSRPVAGVTPFMGTPYS